MVKKKILESHGRGRGMRYYLPKDSLNILEVYSVSSDCSNSATLPKKRLAKEELISLVTETCSDWISLEDIVNKTGKSNSYLRNNIIPLMIAQKRLEMLYPGTPNHPKQKYRVSGT